jgi:hypothetical protein
MTCSFCWSMSPRGWSTRTETCIVGEAGSDCDSADGRGGHLTRERETACGWGWGFGDGGYCAFDVFLARGLATSTMSGALLAIENRRDRTRRPRWWMHDLEMGPEAVVVCRASVAVGCSLL